MRKTRGHQIETLITLAAALAVAFFTPSTHPFAALAAEQNEANEAELQKCSKLIEEKHYKEAYQGFKKLADNGCPYSQCMVGMMTRKGLGIPKDPKAALTYFEHSAKQGFGDAQRWLGEMYLKGEGTSTNRQKALEWFEKAARNDIVEAQYKIGHLYRTSGAADLKARGTAWLAKASKTGIADLENQVNKVPQIQYSGSPNTYSNGLTNLARSWGGYAAAAKNLASAQQ
ncbi:MAG TPA: tetratricopeptide repeat protein [Oculatellaceae cyanobacterium]